MEAEKVSGSWHRHAFRIMKATAGRTLRSIWHIAERLTCVIRFAAVRTSPVIRVFARHINCAIRIAAAHSFQAIRLVAARIPKIIHRAPGQFRRVLARIRWRRLWIGAGCTLAAAVLILALIIWRLIATAPEIDASSVSPSKAATWICDSEGTLIRRLAQSEANRDIVPLSSIPESLREAILAIEDSRFYEHNGIDLRGILRAFRNGILSGSFSEGASTITQQLIKNTVFTDWTQENSFAERFARKIQEQYLAVKLEKELSKEQILEDYLNTINFGSGCYGVQAAAQRYLGKDVQELTLAESAMLAAIPQSPTGCNPISSPDANRARQQLVLRYMNEQGYISESELAAALEEDVYAKVQAYNETWETESVYSYYEDALIEQTAEVLMSELGYTSEQAWQAIYSGGLRIWSAQDESLQEICDEEFSNEANFPEAVQYGIDYSLSIKAADGTIIHYGTTDLQSFVREKLNADFNLMCETKEEGQAYVDAFREYVLEQNAVVSERLTFSPQPQASLVLIEQETGFVRALVGGRGEKTASLTLNRATDSLRQPGSTFKILTAYAPALDLCGQTLATLYENTPYTYADGTPVSNWDITDYTGTVTIREAISRSINVVAVRCLTEITPRLGFESAERFGISTLVDDRQGEGGASDMIQPLALGGITRGVSGLELCAAYASIASGGMYGKPLFFTKILDRDGNVLIDCSGRTAAAAAAKDSDVSSDTSFGSFTRVLQESTSFLLTSAMQDVVSSTEGTAFGVSAAEQPVAGKTGTTSNYKDIWFVGYTPYYTCCVWGGYDNNQSLPEGTAHSYSKTLWTAVMSRIHTGLPIREFTVPASVESVLLCSESHRLAREDTCPSVYTEYFTIGTAPEAFCDIHEPAPETEGKAAQNSETKTGLIYQELLDQLLTEAATAAEEDSGSQAETGLSDSDHANSVEDKNAAGSGETAADSQTGSDITAADGQSGSDITAADRQSDSDITAADRQSDSDITAADRQSGSGEAASGDAAEEGGGDTGTPDETSSLEDLLGRLNAQGFELY